MSSIAEKNQNNQISKIGQEILLAVLSYKKNEITNIVSETLKLQLYGTRLPKIQLNFPQENAFKQFPLHCAVIDNSLAQLRRLCLNQDKTSLYNEVNASDPLGMTPLMLAVKLNLREAAIVICENGGDPFLRTHPQMPTPYEEALDSKQEQFIKHFILAAHLIKQRQWEAKKESIMKQLEEIQDFSCEMKWEHTSNFIPFIHRWTPSDSYKIFKNGSNVRIDMSLIGYKNSDWQRGAWTILFKGRGTHNQGTLLLIDNEKGTITDLFGDLSMTHVEQKVDRLIRKEESLTEYFMQNLNINQCYSWRGEEVFENCGPYRCKKFNSKGILVPECFKGSDKPYKNINFQKISTYQNYLDILNKHQLNHQEISMSGLGSTEKLQLLNKNCKIFNNTSGSKNVSADLWLTEQISMNISNILPIIEIITAFSNNFDTLRDLMIGLQQINSRLFPIKIVIPMLLSISVLIEFSNFKFQQMQLHIFTIDDQIRKRRRAAQHNLTSKQSIHNITSSIQIQDYKKQSIHSYIEDNDNQYSDQTPITSPAQGQRFNYNSTYSLKTENSPVKSPIRNQQQQQIPIKNDINQDFRTNPILLKQPSLQRKSENVYLKTEKIEEKEEDHFYNQNQQNRLQLSNCYSQQGEDDTESIERASKKFKEMLEKEDRSSDLINILEQSSTDHQVGMTGTVTSFIGEEEVKEEITQHYYQKEDSYRNIEQTQKVKDCLAGKVNIFNSKENKINNASQLNFNSGRRVVTEKDQQAPFSNSTGFEGYQLNGKQDKQGVQLLKTSTVSNNNKLQQFKINENNFLDNDKFLSKLREMQTKNTQTNNLERKSYNCNTQTSYCNIKRKTKDADVKI